MRMSCPGHGGKEEVAYEATCGPQAGCLCRLLLVVQDEQAVPQLQVHAEAGPGLWSATLAWCEVKLALGLRALAHLQLAMTALG